MSSRPRSLTQNTPSLSFRHRQNIDRPQTIHTTVLSWRQNLHLRNILLQCLRGTEILHRKQLPSLSTAVFLMELRHTREHYPPCAIFQFHYFSLKKAENMNQRHHFAILRTENNLQRCSILLPSGWKTAPLITKRVLDYILFSTGVFL